MQRSLLAQLLNNGRKFATPVTPYRQSNCIIPAQPFIQSPSQQSPPSQQQQLEQPKMEIPTEENTQIELTAVPKKRVSYTRNRKRNSAKKYLNIHHYTVCSKCATPKLKHNLCMTCLRKNSI